MTEGVSSINEEHQVMKRRRSSFKLFKSALSLLHNNNNNNNNNNNIKKNNNPPSKPASLVDSSSNNGSNWKKIVEYIRPLHLQRHQSPPCTPVSNDRHEAVVDQFEDTLSPESPFASDAGTMSQYASANNLHELEDDADSEEKEEKGDEGKEIRNSDAGDIDVKAEQFIAQFYQQMRLQRSHRRRRV